VTPEQILLIQQIRDAVKCPIDWELITIGKAPGLVTELSWFWSDLTKKYERDNECRHVFVQYDDPDDIDCFRDPDIDDPDAEGDNPKILREELRNIVGLALEDGSALENGWIKAARKEYEEKLGALSRIKVADASVQRKHFRPANVSTEQRLKKSKDGASILSPQIESRLEEIVWACIDDNNWKRIALEHFKYLYVEYPSVVGASRGRATNFLKFDFDLSTPVVHAYPILRSEIPAGEHAVFCDD